MSLAARQPSPDQPWPTVLLWHEVPGGTDHADWMLASDPRGTAPLTTFRLDASPLDLGAGGTCGARLIGAHRAAWLDLEGELSGGRGAVRRLARGAITAWQRGEARWTITVRWTARSVLEQQISVHPTEVDCWCLQVMATDPHGGSMCNR